MADQASSTLPRILLARGGFWPNGGGDLRLPTNAPVPPVDRDLGGFRLPWSAPATEAASVWLPASVLAGPTDRIGEAVRAAVGGAQPAGLIVTFPRQAEASVAIVARAAALRAAPLGLGASPPMLGLRAAHLVGGRQHLALLTALRRLAEEWDVGFALDLTGSFDPQWEAEAAVVRLGKRLQLIRVGSAAIAASPIDRARVARRALLAAIERAPNAAVSIAPQVPWWRPFGGEERARAWLQAEQQLRRWMVPPPIEGVGHPDPADRRSPRQSFPPA